ncbi:MAG TPA: VWA domain-containing protein, partial [Candidatus Eisenbacteria bacterium]
MTFEHPGWLAWLMLLVPLALIEWRAALRAERSIKLLFGARPLPGLIIQRPPGRRIGLLALRLAAVALLGVGAAGPQWGREAVRRQSQGSDIAFVVDVSASMQTRDVPPSRMEEARREAEALLERLQGSRVGVVAFAGDAVRLCPLTLDQAAVRLTLETIGPGTVSEPGTDLGRALRTGLKLLPAGRRDEQAMVLWTDGEDLEGHAREAIDDVRRAGLRVFVVGVGTPAGDVIPMLDVAGVTVDVKRDEHGGIVRSRLDEGLLRDLGRASRGNYFSAGRSGGELVRLASSLGSLARSRRGTRLVERPVARFPLCAL